MQIRQVASRCLSYHAAVCFPDVFIGRNISAKIPFELDILITLLLALLQEIIYGVLRIPYGVVQVSDASL
jgi:hypothetical protein